ncbi:MAG: DUF4268 domain-containing protein [Candidatus Hydrogenedentes bacterium]|nr:DUF4268 domain-containing protein [Candidatus Hydrogenedentota bacterium]
MRIERRFAELDDYEMTLGRLERVDLRAAWETEDGHFTPWLAQDENLRLLGQTLGMDLQPHSTEEGVGPFRADILCKDVANDSWVLIENQLERTDHSHLGQLLTYTAGLNAMTVVWIAKHFTDEHRAALDWLNANTPSSVAFFGLELELWRIGDSPYAPKFNVVSRPNEWIKEGHLDLTDKQRFWTEYWTAFKDYLDAANSSVTYRQPGKGARMSFGIGRANSGLYALCSTGKQDLAAGVYFTREHKDSFFEQIVSQKDQIEIELGFALTWGMPEYSDRYICVRQDGFDWENVSDRPRQFAWFKEKLEALDRAFRPRIAALQVPEEGELS